MIVLLLTIIGYAAAVLAVLLFVAAVVLILALRRNWPEDWT